MTISTPSNDPSDPVVRMINALNCIQTRDEHLAADLLDVVGGLLHIIGDNAHAYISTDAVQPDQE